MNTKLLMILFLVVCICSFVPISSSSSDRPSKLPTKSLTDQKIPKVKKPPKVKIDRGYCCVDGKLSLMQSRQCSSKKGTFYSDKSEAERNCGFCCVGGEVKPLNLSQCKKKRGLFFVSRNDAEKKCAGYCCRNGVISKMSKAHCSEKGDQFYTTKAQADKKCTGYCCSELEVLEKTQAQCKAVKGKYFDSEPRADRYCINLKGWCCADGKTVRLSRDACKRKSGVFYTSETAARQKCKAVTGFCNVKGRTLRLAENECKVKKGRWFTSQMVAGKDLRNVKRQPRVRPLPGTKGDEDSPSQFAASITEANQAAVAGISPPGYSFPARITELSANPRPGNSLTIMGEDFGLRTGRVVMYRGRSAHPESSPEIISWSDRLIRVMLPTAFQRGLCEPLWHTVKVFPAQGDGGGAGYTYSGSEGPSYHFELSPNNPFVSSIRPTEVILMDTSSIITIRGRHFGSAYGNRNALIKLIGAEDTFEAVADEWSDENITFRFRSRRGRRLPSGDYRVVVAQEYPCHNETNAGTVTYVGSNDFDLAIDRLIMSRNNRTSFNLIPVIKNNGPGIYSGETITIDYGGGKRSTVNAVLRSGEEATGTESNDDFNKALTTQKITITAVIDGGGSASDNPSNNTCQIRVSGSIGNRTFYCD